MNNSMRILFHAPGLAAFRPAARLPHLLGVQPSVTDMIAEMLPSHKLTGNRGNIIHAEAPAKIFKKSATGSAYGNVAVLSRALGESYADVLAANFDMIIISMANFIRPDHDGTALFTALRALKGRVPYIALGCGMQGNHKLTDMMPGNRELISLFNDEALCFGVRGEKTANWLSDNGFKNSVILGCPSLYVYPHSLLSVDGSSARSRGADADIMTAGHLSVRQDRIVPRGVELAAAFEGVKSSYVVQDEIFAYGALAREPRLYLEGKSEIKAAPLNRWLSNKIGGFVGFERYYYFNESGAWRQAALRHDAFIGDRFHGGVAALQAGVPTIFLAHDNRVSELTSHFALPKLSTEEFRKLGLSRTLDRYLSTAKIEAMKKQYRIRYKEFFETMATFGLQPEVSLKI